MIGHMLGEAQGKEPTRYRLALNSLGISEEGMREEDPVTYVVARSLSTIRPRNVPHSGIS